MTKREVLQAIQERINWTAQAPIGGDPVHKVQRKSFLAGMRIAKRVVARMPVEKGVRR